MTARGERGGSLQDGGPADGGAGQAAGSPRSGQLSVRTLSVASEVFSLKINPNYQFFNYVTFLPVKTLNLEFLGNCSKPRSRDGVNNSKRTCSVLSGALTPQSDVAAGGTRLRPPLSRSSYFYTANT